MNKKGKGKRNKAYHGEKVDPSNHKVAGAYTHFSLPPSLSFSLQYIIKKAAEERKGGVRLKKRSSSCELVALEVEASEKERDKSRVVREYREERGGILVHEGRDEHDSSFKWSVTGHDTTRHDTLKTEGMTIYLSSLGLLVNVPR